MISGLTLIRNATQCGYPIQDVIACLDTICDEIVVMEGHSTDDTLSLLGHPKARIYRDAWDLKSANGTEFKRITDLGLQKCRGEFIFYLQGDELMDPEHIRQLPEVIKNHACVSVPVVHLRQRPELAWAEKDLKNFYNRAIRFFRNNAGMVAHHDAYSFHGAQGSEWASNYPLFHVGYLNAAQVCRKIINHSKYFYSPKTAIGRDVKARAGIAYEILLSLEDGVIDEARAWETILEYGVILATKQQLEPHPYVLPPSILARFPHRK